MLTKDRHAFTGEKEALALLEFSMGFVWQAALRTAVILGVAEQLTTEAKTVEQLSAALNTDCGRLRRILRILASRGLFHCAENDVISLTPMAELLLEDHPWSLRHAILMLTDKTFWWPALELAETVRGGDAFHRLFGSAFYDYWAQQDQTNNVFHRGMYSMSRVENEVLVRAYDFPPQVTVADIAGGYGNLLLNILRHNPTTKGILFDRAEVLAGNILHHLNDNSRWSLIAGNFFETCPSADIYVLKYIVMDWVSEKALQILKNCRKAMPAQGKVLLLEPCIAAADNDPGSYAVDLLLLSSFAGGQVRTPDELNALFSAAGLKLNRIIRTESWLSIIEAVAA